ncbi:MULTISPECIES: hypothetical protein [Cyanophyceae]|uniref:hypothetical protein n=1 Tax=Cyanophyceae TaxID=3028117 RepID=UPI0016836BC2|nr:hypothetical protein [Trichocoleus sp. FACHB-40]MBD2004404.1 hypothetical protein [Trichocoleus sp. FACHB-40]
MVQFHQRRSHLIIAIALSWGLGGGVDVPADAIGVVVKEEGTAVGASKRVEGGNLSFG